MNYRHIYHAGNFADVVKHSILSLTIAELIKKDKALCYLETHAGSGLYDLTAVRKKPEHQAGIGRLLQSKIVPVELQEYLRYVKALNETDTLKIYPGSPWLAQKLLRPIDRLVLSELEEDTCEKLKYTFRGTKNIAIHQQDGYQSMKGFLPPSERRGMVLLDPPYEQNNEWQQLIAAMITAGQRFANGVYLLWYPIKANSKFSSFNRELHAKVNLPCLQVEVNIYPADAPQQLNGSGMLIFNPPWQLAERLHSVLPWLWQTLSPEGWGGWSCKLINK